MIARPLLLLGLSLLACGRNPTAGEAPVDATPVGVHPQAIDDVLPNPGIGVEL